MPVRNGRDGMHRHYYLYCTRRDWQVKNEKIGTTSCDAKHRLYQVHHGTILPTQRTSARHDGIPEQTANRFCALFLHHAI